MPAGMGEEERFAAAVEYGTTPATVGARNDSTELERELEIVALLRAGGARLGPDPASRARARGRLMAAFAQEFGNGDDGSADLTGPLQVIAPVALATRESEAPVRATAAPVTRTPRAGRHSAPEPRLPEREVPEPADEPEPEQQNVRRLGARRADAPRGHRRAAVLGAAAAAALVALAGGGTFASRDALPGEPLYGVKRVAESTSYALTFGEQAKARRHLEQAQRRLDEVEGMVSRNRTVAAGPATTTSDPELVRDTLQEFDTDAGEGSRLLLAGQRPDTAQVQEVRTWATEQSERLSDIRSTLPASDRADESLALLDRVLGQTQALSDPACTPTATGSGTTAAACATTASTPAPERASAEPTPEPGTGKGRGAAASTARDGDTDAGADTDGGDADDAGPGDATGSARTTTKAPGGSGESGRSSGSGDRDEQDRGDGGSGGSDGSGDLSVPLPVSGPVKIPSPLPGVPGIDLGGR